MIMKEIYVPFIEIQCTEVVGNLILELKKHFVMQELLNAIGAIYL
jgi:hypothetical protein